MKLNERLALYLQLTRLNRPIGIMLLLWPTLWGVWIAGNGYPQWHVVLIFTLGTVLMSFPAVLLAASYPFTKRFLAIPQAYLGIAFGFGIPMAFAAQLDEVPPVAWLMLAANVFWAIAYDTEYAMVDRDDDIRIGIHSSALLFGRYDVAAVMICYAITLGLLVLAGRLSGLGGIYFLGLAIAAGS